MMLGLYRAFSVLGAPLIGVYLWLRRIRGKEDPARFSERLGRPGLARPDGPLVWVHAASVGESLSMLPLIGRLVEDQPGLNILVTTGTVTSARLMAERLPEGSFHQYAPVDRIASVRRFLDHWRPDLALWAESEFWPNMITEAASRNIPMILINGRVSPRSFVGWRRFGGLIRELLGCFDLCLGQSDADAQRLRQLGAGTAKHVGNLKFAGPPLPVDEAEFAAIKNSIGTRPVWLAASTHAGEEDMAAQVHQRLKSLQVGLLTLIIPRHPDRGEKVATRLRGQGQDVSLRSNGDAIRPETDIYVADTMGEMGLFFRIAGVVFMGKSLVPLGGQNPLEAARLDCAIVHGPHMMNFEDISERFNKTGAALQVADGEALFSAVRQLLEDTSERERMAAAAKAMAAAEAGVLDAVLVELGPFLEHLLQKDKSRARA
ncbi:MAG: 3-deoxy-D-manno-octulosonic acid transferase [Rhodospirillales bacterium]|nr:3-deoxy-D-manno-octulosonic acid transferase [Rhodospirillales bacterium]